MSVPVSVRFLAGVKAEPFSSSETTSPATRLVPARLIRMAVELPYSTRLSFPSMSFVGEVGVGGSVGIDGALGATVSFKKLMTMLFGPGVVPFVS